MHSPWDYLYQKSKAGAVLRGLDFQISKEYVRNLGEASGGKCARTGIPFRMGQGEGAQNARKPSLDRIDNTLGYLPGNVQIVCWAYNKMKNTFSEEQVLYIAKKIVAHSA